MAFWIRDATLTIGNKQYSLGGLNFTFEIPFEDSDEPPVATNKGHEPLPQPREPESRKTTRIV